MKLTFLSFFIVTFSTFNCIQAQKLDDSEYYCERKMSDQQCENYARNLTLQINRCVDYTINKHGKVIFIVCPQLQCSPTEIFIEEDISVNKKVYPGCCSLCIEQNLNISQYYCERRMSDQQCENYAKTLAKQKDKCTGHKIDKYGKITFVECECPEDSVKVGEEIGKNRKHYPECCPACIAKCFAKQVTSNRRGDHLTQEDKLLCKILDRAN